ncbi:MAG: hypothetical protein PWR10_341 [Halanaerobiales bacterium]|nr:hypothetical protein [Halanaerobiales bacterium]
MAKIQQSAGPELFQALNLSRIPVYSLKVHLQELTLFFKKRYLKQVKTIFEENNIEHLLEEDLSVLKIMVRDSAEKLAFTIKVIELINAKKIRLIEVDDFQDRIIFILEKKERGEIINLLKSIF